MLKLVARVAARRGEEADATAADERCRLMDVVNDHAGRWL